MARQKGVHPVASNRRARHDYFIEETYECGLALHGTEVKSIRQGHVNLKESFAHVKDGEAVEIKATIDGVLRGAIYDGSKVEAGQKIADIHPTMGQEECYTISDKARCIGGSVLEAVMAWESEKPKHRFFGH